MNNLFARFKLIFFLTAIEALTVFAIYAGALDRKTAFILLGAILISMVWLPIEKAVAFFIISIPLFIALPLNQNADNFAAWRLIALWLFLIWFFKNKIYIFLLSIEKLRYLAKSVLWFEWSIIGLFTISSMSLLVADDIGFGLRKIVFLGNFIPLYIVVRSLASTRENRFLFFMSVFFAGLIASAIGFIQFLSIQFASLFDFWKHWASWVIPIFYGTNLSILLEKSNTWFSYYPNSPPTLRLFSIFPDSHSFGLFSLISACAILILAKMTGNKARPWLFIFWCILSLTIYLSGTRGLWLAALPILFGVVIVYLSTNNFINQAKKFSAVFLVSFSIYIGLIYFILDKIALSIAWGECNRTPFLCSDLAVNAYKLPYSLWVVGTALIAALIITSVAFWLTIKTKIFRDQLLPQIILIPLIIFLILLPVSSFIISNAHGIGVVSDDQELLLKRASSILDLSETSNKARLDIWKLSVQSIIHNPILGVGIGNYAKVLSEEIDAAKKGASAHNLYLDFATETGLFGGILLILFFVLLIFYAYKLWGKDNNNYNTRTMGIIFGIYFVWIMLYNFFDVVLVNDKVLLLFVALLGTFSSIFLVSSRENHTVV